MCLSSGQWGLSAVAWGGGLFPSLLLLVFSLMIQKFPKFLVIQKFPSFISKKHGGTFLEQGKRWAFD